MRAKIGKSDISPGGTDPNDVPSGIGAQPWFPKVAITVSIVMTVLAASLIYYRWYNAFSPNSYVIPFIPEASRAALSGAEVIVNTRGSEVARVRLDQGNKFTAPVLVESDEIYTVTARLGDQVLMHDRQVSVPYRRGIRIAITTRPANEP